MLVRLTKKKKKKSNTVDLYHDSLIDRTYLRCCQPICQQTYLGATDEAQCLVVRGLDFMLWRSRIQMLSGGGWQDCWRLQSARYLTFARVFSASGKIVASDSCVRQLFSDLLPVQILVLAGFKHENKKGTKVRINPPHPLSIHLTVFRPGVQIILSNCYSEVPEYLNALFKMVVKRHHYWLLKGKKSIFLALLTSTLTSLIKASTCL